MTVYLACTGADFDPLTPGPWSDVHRAGPGLSLLDSQETLSRVYHELKWSLPDGTPVLVAPLTQLPKLSRYEPGTTSWLRARLQPGSDLVPDDAHGTSVRSGEQSPGSGYADC